jgi:hypothetical protein
MDAVLGHGFHPLKARQRRSIPNLQTVHRHGRIPADGSKSTFMSQWRHWFRIDRRRPSLNVALWI